MISVLWWLLRALGILAALLVVFAVYCCLVVGGREDEEMERFRRNEKWNGGREK